MNRRALQIAPLALCLLVATACSTPPEPIPIEAQAGATEPAEAPSETASLEPSAGPLTEVPETSRECLRRAWGEAAYSDIERGLITLSMAQDASLAVCLFVQEGPPDRLVEPVSSRVTLAREASEAWLPAVRQRVFLAAAVGPYADAELLALPEGGYRMYVEELGVHNIASFHSADGFEWAREDGVRIPGAAFPDALLLEDGRVRLYFQSGGGIASAISSDGGLNFELEPGLRVERGWHADLDRDNVGASTTVRLPDGRFRMYYRAGIEDEAYVNRQKNVILSASSDDGLTWTRDDGVRIAPADWLPLDAPQDIRYIDGPEAVVTADGLVKLYFWGVRLCSGVCLSISVDGRDFGPVEQVYAISDSPGQVNIGDPAVLQLPDGRWLMFYGHAVYGDNGIWIAQRQR